MLDTDNMGPVVAVSNDVLQQAVYYHLDNSSLDNALFFAERLGAQDKTTEAAFLLAYCYLRLGDHRSAYHVSKAAGYRGTHLGCSYVFAQACLRLGLWKDGITALEKSRGLWSSKNNMGKHAAGLRIPHPDAAACHCLLGHLYRGYDDKDKAVICFEEALKVNPWMWDAFTSLCDMGVAIRVANIFKSNETLVRNFDQVANGALNRQLELSSSTLESLHVPKRSNRSTAQDAADPFGTQRAVASNDISSFSNLQDDGNNFMSKIAAAKARNGNFAPTATHEGMDTPVGYGTNTEARATRVVTGPEPPHAPVRRRGQLQAADQEAPPRMGYKLQTKRRGQAQETVDAPPDPAASLLKSSSITERKRTVSGQPVHSRPMHGEEPGAPQRRSARLNVFNKSTTKPNSGAATVGATAGRELKRARAPISNRLVRSGASVGRVVSGNRRGNEDTANMDVDRPEGPTGKEVTAQRPQPKASDPELVTTEEGLKLTLDLLRRYGYGYQQLSQFACQEALQSFSTLPKAHQDTPWVLAQMGRAQYEQAAYAEAERHFRRLRIMSPTRMQGMEVYSTILWHLKRETDLSFLAHELVDSAWLAPEAWCALGNAWSLAKDHEQALRCFRRATQLDDKFAYAYTLQGHEHMANEEYDKALTAFRQSVAADRRHYNAYYGIGMVYEKLGNYDKAIFHFDTASKIHPTNAVLICCIGTVLEKQKQIMQALHCFSKATELAPRAAQARYRKARALLGIGRTTEARQELLILKDLAPDDARVHFMLGKLYKAENNKSQAVRHFTQALSLDPKASQQIKEAIESLEDEDGLEDSIMQ